MEPLTHNTASAPSGGATTSEESDHDDTENHRPSSQLEPAKQNSNKNDRSGPLPSDLTAMLKRDIEAHSSTKGSSSLPDTGQPTNQTSLISKRTMQQIPSTATATINPLSLPDLPIDERMPQAMPTAPNSPPPTLGPGAYRGGVGGSMERTDFLYKGGQRVLGRESSSARFHEADSTGFSLDYSIESPPSEHHQDAVPPLSHLAEARMVIQSNIHDAKEVDPAEEERKLVELKRQKKRFLCRIGVAIVAICSIVLALTLGFTLGKKKDEIPPTLVHSPPTMFLESHILSLLPEYTLAAMEEDKQSPQASAYQWIMADPNLLTYSDERILQRFALATIFYATNGVEWTNNAHWMSYEVHECEWHAQDAIKVVTNLYKLSGEFLPQPLRINVLNPYANASFPCEDPAVGKQYSHLWLLANNLQGRLPPELTLLTSLNSVVLAFNSLTGHGLSTEVGKLSSLKLFVSQRNKFSGTIPTEVGLLSSLQTFIFRANKLSGTIPTEFGLLSDTMKMLDLPKNQLSGVIPKSLASLVEMNYLNLHTNKLTGTIPTVVGQLSELEWLAFGANQLLGPIPSEIGLLESLEALRLSKNHLTGTVPLEIGNLVTGSLKISHIYQNNLTGTLPGDLCFIDTVSDYNHQLIGCNCSCSFELWYDRGLQVCSPLNCSNRDKFYEELRNRKLNDTQ